MRVTLAHPHIYSQHFNLAEEMILQQIKTPIIKMPENPWNPDYITNFPDLYVKLTRDQMLGSLGWPDYDPKIEVVK